MNQPQNVPHLAVSTSVDIVLVTSEMAARWLRQNTSNRRLDASNVDMYVRIIRAGRWHLSNDAVSFGPDGTVLNGQHRLTAIVKTGIACELLVMTNAKVASQVAMDAQKKRTAGDYLAIMGHTNYTHLAAVTRVILLHQIGQLANGGNYKLSNDEVAEFVAQHPDLAHAVTRAQAMTKKVDCPQSVVGAAIWLLTPIDPDDMAAFMNAWRDGVNLAEGDPILALTARLREVRRNRRIVSRAEYLALILRAWNAWRDGRTVTGFPLRTRASGPVEIPEPK